MHELHAALGSRLRNVGGDHNIPLDADVDGGTFGGRGGLPGGGGGGGVGTGPVHWKPQLPPWPRPKTEKKNARQIVMNMACHQHWTQIITSASVEINSAVADIPAAGEEAEKQQQQQQQQQRQKEQALLSMGTRWHCTLAIYSLIRCIVLSYGPPTIWHPWPGHCPVHGLPMHDSAE